MTVDDARFLIQAERVWRTILAMFRLTVGLVQTDTLPEVTVAHLLHATSAAGLAAEDTADLMRRCDDMAGQVRDAFERHIGPLS
jgi:hypothetical protein